MVFGLHIRPFFWRRETCAFNASRRGSFKCRPVDAVTQSTSVWLYFVSADKAGSFDKAEVLEDANSRRVPVSFLGVLAGAPQFTAKVRTNSVS